MARFDVYRLRDGSLVVDCQADFLRDIGTRFVLPLLPRGEGPEPNARINPEFDIEGERLVLIEDATSPVPGFEHLQADFIREMRSRGMQITTTRDFLA